MTSHFRGKHQGVIGAVTRAALCSCAVVFSTIFLSTDVQAQRATIRRVSGVAPFVTYQREGDAGTSVTIRGEGFDDEVVVDVGDTTIYSIKLVDNALQVSLPPLNPGHYEVRVRWLGRDTELCAPQLLEVRRPPCAARPIAFDHDSDKPSDDDLTRALGCLARREPENVVVLGFASLPGRAEYNRALALRRANAVKEAISRRFSSYRVGEPISFGSSLPASRGGGAGEEARNRRVIIISAGKPPCGPMSVRLGSKGEATAVTRDLLKNHAYCFADRGVTDGLVVVPATAPPQLEAQVREWFQADVASFGKPNAAVELQTVLAERADYDKLHKAFARAAGQPAMGPGPDPRDIVIYPVSWFSSAGDAPAGTGVHDATCPNEKVLPPEPVAPPPPVDTVVPQSVPALPRPTFATVQLGGLYAPKQYYAGVGFRMGQFLVSVPPVDVALGVSAGGFWPTGTSAGKPDPNATMLSEVGLFLGPRFTYKRFYVQPAGDLALLLPPTFSAVFGGELTFGFRLTDVIDLGMTFSVGAAYGALPSSTLVRYSLGSTWWF
jgi:hypothetical protein